MLCEMLILFLQPSLEQWDVLEDGEKTSRNKTTEEPSTIGSSKDKTDPDTENKVAKLDGTDQPSTNAKTDVSSG